MIALLRLSISAQAGTISGYVSDEATTYPISQLDFNLYDADWTFIEIDADTDGTGNYTFFNVPAGSYFIKAIPIYPQHYRPEYWNNSYDREGAELITLTEGENKTGIDFVMSSGQFIGGKVLDITATGIFGIDINVYDADWRKMDVDAETDPFGKYFIGGLPPGSYFVMANPDYPQPYTEQYFDHSNGPINADLVELLESEDTIGINFSLEEGCYAEGDVRDSATQVPISGISMKVYNHNGTKMRIEGRSKADGRYSVGPFRPGDYFVRADPTYPKGYPDQYYSDAYRLSDALPVTLSGLKPISGIDFNLPRGSYVRGFVSDAHSGSSLPDIKVKFYDSDWKLCEMATCKTRADGSYLSGALRPDMHFVKAVPVYPQPYIDEYYPDAVEKDDAVALTINPDQEILDISFALDRGGYIRGSVFDQLTGDPANDIDLDIYADNWDWVSYSDHTDHAGTFVLGALPFGQYFLACDPGPTPGYRPEFYNDSFWPSGAQILTLTADSNLENIVFDLVTASRITGRITDDVSGQGVEGIDIEIYRTDHTLVPVHIVSSTVNGVYDTYGLPAGTYIVFAHAPNQSSYSSEYYREASSFETAQPVSVDGNATVTGIDFTLHATGNPTPPPAELGVEIDMPSAMYRHGDTFYTNAIVTNPGASLGSLPLFVVLDVYGDYYFWPGWVHYAPPQSTELDFQYINVDSGVQIVPVLPMFDWPRIEGPDVTGLFFYGAILSSDFSALVGKLGTFEFGYGY